MTRWLAFALAVFAGVALAEFARAEDAAHDPAALPYLDLGAADYRTPRAGQGFRTTVLGREAVVPPRDRRSVTAVALGTAIGFPGPEDADITPFASLYLWRRPESERHFLRATLVGLYDDIFYAHALAEKSPFEAVLTFENTTIPFDRSEWADGEKLQDEELMWSWLRAGIGLGYRRQAGPEQDNMFSVSATFEPAYLYFDNGGDAAPSFEEPHDGFEFGGRIALKLDALERNVLELAHSGHALGVEGWVARRTSWDDWGLGDSQSAGSGNTPRLLTGYLVWAGGLPGVESERHRMIASLHGGVGGGVDRFSAPRLGGGPSSREYGAIERPLVPGAGLNEFYTDYYTIGLVEYRFEPIFFTYLHLRAAAAWFERDRIRQNGSLHRQDDVLPSLGARITTGFFFETRLQIDYDYGFELRRGGDKGGQMMVVQISKQF